MWEERVAAEIERPPIDAFFAGRYEAAQAVTTDATIDTDPLDVDGAAEALTALLGVR